MSGIVHFFETDRGKRLKNMIIGLGASVVILGALFKILHWPFATEMLMGGMITEAVLFAMLGLLPPHKDYYWERLYPNLDIAPEVDKTFVRNNNTGAQVGGGSSSSSDQMSAMLEKAGVTDDVFSKLGDGFKRIADNANKMSEISDAVAATNEYAASAKTAAGTLSVMNVAFVEATDSIKAIGKMGTESQAFHEQVQTVTKNLASLNAMYELELQDTSSHLKAMNKYYGNLMQAMDNMNSSIEDSAKYKEQMAQLSRNLASLNNVYGNMLSAMSSGARS
jgi:gliding motility-associated protein GldL